jgi:CubicO group peptidase (beta-lactamase class C family)
MLLTHSSSLAGPLTDEELPGFYDWFPPDAHPGLDETLSDYLIPGGQHYIPGVWTDAAPGQRELYSNLGVTLLGYIVEFVSGEEFHSYCRNYIFLPLDMPDTSFRMSDLDPAKVAIRYGEYYNPLIHYSRRDFPAGQLKSSAADFSHFLMACMNGGVYKGQRILKESTIEDMLKIHNPASGICLIWNCTVGGWFGHSGGLNGASTYVEFQKEDKVGLIILSNVYISKGNPFYPPRGSIFGLIRKKANEFRRPAAGSMGLWGIDFYFLRHFLLKK